MSDREIRELQDDVRAMKDRIAALEAKMSDKGETSPAEVHEAMQSAPHDGKPYRQARAAIADCRDAAKRPTTEAPRGCGARLVGGIICGNTSVNGVTMLCGTCSHQCDCGSCNPGGRRRSGKCSCGVVHCNAPAQAQPSGERCICDANQVAALDARLREAERERDEAIKAAHLDTVASVMAERERCLAWFDGGGDPAFVYAAIRDGRAAP